MSRSSSLRVALFVEGAPGAYSKRTREDIGLLWNERMQAVVEIGPFDRVIPISKKTLVAMDPSLPRMSGASETLDQLMARELKRRSFDAALVLWDLRPAWNPDGDMCRWNETLSLYEGIARSDVLPSSWVEAAAARHAELSSRSTPSMRPAVPHLARSGVLGVCMEPTFEELLCCDESAVRAALGLDGVNVPDWPNWGRIRSSEDQIARAINVAIRHYRRSRRRAPWMGAAPTTYAQGKDAWASFLLRELSANERFLDEASAVPFIQRLDEIARSAI